MDPQTLEYYINHLVDLYGDKEALVHKKKYRTKRWSYLDLYNFSCKVATFFAKREIRQGDKILIYAPNRPEWCGVFLGCALSGVIAVPVDSSSKPDFTLDIYKKVGAKLIITSAYKQVDNTEQVFIEDLEFILKDIKNNRTGASISGDTILEIVYTSGTTSDPKGVIVTNKNLVRNIRSLRKAMPVSRDSVFLSVLPLSHLFEQVLGFMDPLRFGARIVYPESRKSSTITNILRQEKITNIVAVPAFLEVLRDKIYSEISSGRFFDSIMKGAKNAPISLKRFIFRRVHIKLGRYLKFFVVGGAPLAKEVEDFWNTLGMIVLQGYGLTEASPVVSCNTVDSRKVYSVGRPLPDVKVKIDQEGEILVAGPNITPGYYQDPSETKKRYEGEWFSTGDIGFVDKDGYLFLRGRKKNMILSSSGVNVYPEDLERVLNEISGVEDSCVLSEKSNGKTIIKAAVVTSQKLDPTKILKQANNKLNSNQQIHKVVMWPGEDFPRTTTLKTKRRDVAAYLQSKTHISNTPTPGDKLGVILSRFTQNHITKESNLVTDLKIDSIHRVELLSAIEEEYDVEIPEDAIDQYTVVRDLEKLVEQGVASSTKQKFKNWPLRVTSLRAALQRLLFVILGIFSKLDVIGIENLHGLRKPLIFVANHASHLDTPLILKSLPSPTRNKVAVAAADDYFFKGKRFIPIAAGVLLNTYPFSRTTSIRKSLEYSGKLIDRGYSILIYPEGTRSTDGRIHSFRSGIGVLVKEMDVDVLPLKIVGTHEILPKGKLVPRRGAVKVKFGPLTTFSHKESYLDIAKKLEEGVRSIS